MFGATEAFKIRWPTVHSEASGRSSDVDALIFLPDTPDYDAVADSLRDIAYDVMPEPELVVELHLLNETTFDRHHPEEEPIHPERPLRGELVCLTTTRRATLQLKVNFIKPVRHLGR